MQALFQQDLCPPTINQASHKPGHIQECGPDPSHSTPTADLLWEPDLTLSGRTKVISGSNDGFKSRNTLQQPNLSKSYRCGTPKVHIFKLCAFLNHFFNCNFFLCITHTSGGEESSEWWATAGTSTEHERARAKTLYERKCAASCHADSTSSFFMTLSSERPTSRRGESDYAQRLERWSCKTQERKMEGGKNNNFHLPKSLQRQEHHKQAWGSKRPSYGISHFYQASFSFFFF